MSVVQLSLRIRERQPPSKKHVPTYASDQKSLLSNNLKELNFQSFLIVSKVFIQFYNMVDSTDLPKPK